MRGDADCSGVLISNSAFPGWFRSNRSSNICNVHCEGAGAWRPFKRPQLGNPGRQRWRVCLWLPYVIGQTIYIFMLWFVLLFFSRLISAAPDWMSAIHPHMVWPQCEFKMQVWNLLHAARWKHRMQKSRQKSPSGHHRTTLSGYIFATKARINNRKKTS